MKINPSGIEKYQGYVQAAKAESAAKPGGGSKTGGVFGSKTDTVSISEEAASRAEARRLAGGLAAEVEGAASPERIEALRVQVAAGEYHVSSEDLADAILDMRA